MYYDSVPREGLKWWTRFPLRTQYRFVQQCFRKVNNLSERSWIFRMTLQLSSLSFNFRLLIVLSVVVFVVNILLYLLLFTHSCARIITLQEIPSQLVPVPHNLDLMNDSSKQLCDIMPTIVNGSWPHPVMTEVSDTYLDKLAVQLKVKPGGAWSPLHCVSQHRVGIVVPYKDRKTHLNMFLAYMHPFLQFQNLDYRIVIVEQSDQRPFNRAKLFNVGYSELEKIAPYHCYIFHDVDLIPQNVLNVYGCTQVPRHMSANIDIFNYEPPYDMIFGGAVAILKSKFEHVNGFSNKFFGWGGEDDDFYNRVTKNGSTICRFEPSISRYTMLKHKKEKPNEDRYYYLQTGIRRFVTDGLNSLKYNVQKIDLLPLYTRVLVDL